MIELQNETQTAVFEANNVNYFLGNFEYNLVFLRSQQNYLNDRLRTQGHIFLNEVFDLLSLPRTSDGAISGWVLDGGVGFIDFDVFGNDEKMRKIIETRNASIELKFNIDGIIYDKI